MSISRISSCVGCRYRRRKCDQKRPICSECRDIGLPIVLCKYRKMSRKGKSTELSLQDEKQKNMRLKQDLDQLKSTILLENGHKDYIHNYEKDVFFKTVKKSPDSMSHFGSTSWACFVDLDPLFKEVTCLFHEIIANERLKHIHNPVTRDHSLDDILNQSRSSLPGRLMSNQRETSLDLEDQLNSIKQTIRHVEPLLPNIHGMKELLQLIEDHKSVGSALGTITKGIEYWKELIWTFVEESATQPGKSIISMQLPSDFYKISNFLLFLAMISFSLFIQNISTSNHWVNNGDLYSLLDHQDALYIQLHYYFSKSNELRYLYTVETYQASILSYWCKQYIPFPPNIDHQKRRQTKNFIRHTIPLGKVLHLHENIDVYYAHKTKDVRDKLKLTWSLIGSLDALESFESGTPPKIKDVYIRYDEIKSIFTETPIIMSQVLNYYQKIEMMDDTYIFIGKMQSNIITPLKKLLKEEYPPLQEEVDYFTAFNFDASSSYTDFFDRGQGIALRSVVYSVIQAFYRICYKRLTILGKQDTTMARILKVKIWKYSLLILHLLRKLLTGIDRVTKSKHAIHYHPTITLLLSFQQFFRISLRRSLVFILGQFLEMLQLDDITSFMDYFLNEPSGGDISTTRILQILKESDQTKSSFSILDLGDLELDDNHDELLNKFEKFNDKRFLIITVTKLIQDSVDLSEIDQFNFGVVTYNYMIVIALKLARFFLKHAFKSLEFNPNKDERDPQEYVELVRKSFKANQGQFNFNKFFQATYRNKHSDAHKLEELFKGMDSLVVDDSRAYFQYR